MMIIIMSSGMSSLVHTLHCPSVPPSLSRTRTGPRARMMKLPLLLPGVTTTDVFFPPLSPCPPVSAPSDRQTSVSQDGCCALHETADRSCPYHRVDT